MREEARKLANAEGREGLWHHEWRQARFGDRIKQIEHLQKQLEHVERAGPLLQTLSLQMYDRGIVEKATKLHDAATAVAVI